MRRLLSYDMGAMFCSKLKASTLSVVATKACNSHRKYLWWGCKMQKTVLSVVLGNVQGD